MPGIIGADDISGSLDAQNVVIDVLTRAIEMTNLLPLCPQVNVPELTATIPIMTHAAVIEDVEEFEVTEISSSAFTHVDFSLKKDRVLVAASDEATYKSKAGDPLTLTKNSAGDSLANILDKKIVTAFETSPQTGSATAVWSTVTSNPLVDLATAVAAVTPYKADFVVMPQAVYTAYMQLDFLETTAAYIPSQAAGSVARIPGLELDIYVNDNVTAKSAIIGASNGTPAAIGNGPVKVREWDEPSLGAGVYQMDVFRQAVAPVLKNDSSLNMAIYHLTALIS